MLSSDWELPDMDPFLSPSKLDFTVCFMCRVIQYSFHAACNHFICYLKATRMLTLVCVVQY